MAAERAKLVGPDELAKAGPPLTVRAFFGLLLPEAQRITLSPYLEACFAAAPAFRWTPAANLHLTIRFLGQVELAGAEALAENLAGRDLRDFQLQLGEVGTFQRGRMARVVWVGLSRGADQARELGVEIEAACVAAGLEGETRRLQPHLTLARARARAGAALPALPPLPEIAPWRAGQLILYRSRLGRAGSVYEPLRTLRLS